MKIPKLHKGSLLPNVLEPLRLVNRAASGVSMTAYLAGTLTRKGDDLVNVPGYFLLQLRA